MEISSEIKVEIKIHNNLVVQLQVGKQVLAN